MEISKYRIIVNHLKSGIEKDINALIKEGWQPFGNPTINGSQIYQAMVKSKCDHVFATKSLTDLTAVCIHCNFQPPTPPEEINNDEC